MKIAFVDVTVTNSYGGVQTAVWELARQLHDLGHEVFVYGGEGDVRPDLGGRSIVVKTFSFVHRGQVPNFGTRFRKFCERFSFAMKARKDVEAEDFDWIVFTKPFDMVWPFLLPRNGKTRYLFSGHGTDFFRADRWLSKRIDAWVACSYFNAWQLYQHFKCHPQVIFNGVQTESFHPSRRDQEFRENLGIKDGDVLLAYAGRIVGWKGIGFILDALVHPKLAMKPVKVLVVGRGPELEALQRKAAVLDISDRVIFHPAVPHADLPKIYASADVGVFPSVGDEGFPITVLEAMSCGIPVVATNIGGTQETVGNERNCGALVGIGNTEQLVDELDRLVSDPGLRKGMGKQARQRIVDNFTWKMAAERLLKAMQA